MERARIKRDEATELANIVRAAQGGDEQALALLVEHTQDRLHRFLLFLSGDAALANDIAQDTYLYVFEHLKKVTEPQAFWRWLFLVGRNKFLDHKKSPRNKAHASVDQLERADAAHSPERRELVLEVREALQALNAEERAILLLVDMEQHTAAEAAEILKISPSAAQSRLRRARAAFHEKYFK